MRILPFLLILAAALVICGLLAAVTVIAAWSRRQKSVRPHRQLIGSLASVEKSLNPEGSVLVRGELWGACTRAGEHVTEGHANVRVTGAQGHLLVVEPVRVTGQPK